MPPVVAVRLAWFDPPFEVEDMRFHALRLSVVIRGGDGHWAYIRGPSSPYTAIAIALKLGKAILMIRRQLTQLPNPRHNVEAESCRNEMFHELLNDRAWHIAAQMGVK